MWFKILLQKLKAILKDLSTLKVDIWPVYSKYLTSPRFSWKNFYLLLQIRLPLILKKILPEGLMLYPDLANKTLLFCSAPGLPFISVEFPPASSRCCQHRIIGALLTFKVLVNVILKSRLFSSYCHQSRTSSTPLFSGSLNLIKIHACKIGKLTSQIPCDSAQPASHSFLLWFFSLSFLSFLFYSFSSKLPDW